MFSFFPFIESFFFLSLGITFVLIFLMVFHFKQRIEKLERKNNDLSDLSNKIVKEITNLHTIYLQSNSNSPPQKNNFIHPIEHICENIVFSTSCPISFSHSNQNPEENQPTENTYKKIIVMNSVANDPDDDSTDDSNCDSEYESESDSEYDLDSIIVDNDNDFELENVEEEIQFTTDEIDSLHVLRLSSFNPPSPIPELDNELHHFSFETPTLGGVLSENGDTFLALEMRKGVKEEGDIEFTNSNGIDTNINVINQLNEEEEDKEPTTFRIEDAEKGKTEKSSSGLLPMNYHKMNVQNLKMLVISKGLCSDTSKMKRADLIKLLSEEESEQEAEQEAEQDVQQE